MDNRWLRTFTGLRVDYDDPDPASINIDDIAHSLANTCRYNGHTLEFYSVAQHSCVVMDILARQKLPNDALFCGLMHDAHEAYVGDLISPLKRMPELEEGFRILDKRFMDVVDNVFDIPWNIDIKGLVKTADEIALATEMRDLTSRNDYQGSYMPATFKIEPCSREKAKLMFQTRFVELRGEPVPRGPSAA
jgi:hypothetical protein